jgi:hypothetical protein
LQGTELRAEKLLSFGEKGKQFSERATRSNSKLSVREAAKARW